MPQLADVGSLLERQVLVVSLSLNALGLLIIIALAVRRHRD